MLKSISLENYKCFKDKTDIEIAPLTVLCGVNSSGKSSILKSLLMLKQSYEIKSNLNSITLNGIYTNNGLFNNVANLKDKEIRIRNMFLFEKSQYMTTQEKTALKDLNSIYDCKDKITQAKIEIEILFKNQNRKNLSYGDNIISEIIIWISTNTIYHAKLEFILIEDFRYNIFLEGLPSKYVYTKLENTVCHFDGLQIVNLYYTSVIPEQYTDKLLSSIFIISRIIASQYKDINYISPLRNAPERRYIIEQDIENIGIYGQFVPQALEKFKNSSGKINSLPKPENDLFSKKYSSISCKVHEAINQWLNYFGIESYTTQGESELLRLSIGGHNILDVGFGISQALPIIVSGVILPYKSTLLLEQPEVHLHPKMQMAMADLLIATSMAHKNVVIETHSDHIINRISRRMMENEYIRNNTCIKFIDKNEDDISFIEPINVDPIKGIVTDNENFFTEFASETEKIIKAGYENRIERMINGNNTFGRKLL